MRSLIHCGAAPLSAADCAAMAVMTTTLENRG